MTQFPDREDDDWPPHPRWNVMHAVAGCVLFWVVVGLGFYAWPWFGG